MLRCSNCGSTETLAEIVAKHPQAISCCPERNMVEDWRGVPVTMEFLAELFDAFCGADGHNLVVKIAASKICQKL